MKFSQTKVNELRADKGKSDQTVWDEAMPGFGIRFRNGGPGTYVIQFHVAGTQTQGKLGLGKVSKLTLEAARGLAREHFVKVANGTNPALERAQTAATASTASTIGSLVPGYLKALADKGRVPSYLSENRRSLEVYFRSLHRFAPDDVSRKMVAAELDEIAGDKGPIAMTRSRAHLSAMYTWAIKKGHVDRGNPVSGTEKFNPKKRDRQHTEAELRAIWQGSDDRFDYDVIQKLVMLTAARRAQIGSLKRREVNRAEKFIKLQGAGRSKNGTTFILPLSRQALALIEMVWDRRSDSSGYLFGDGGADGAGFSGWSNSEQSFSTRLGDEVDDYWLHDFRRTFQNIGQTKLKIPLHITDACMNHIGGEAQKGVRRNYNFAEYLDEKVEAMDKWGRFIEGVVNPGRNLKIAA